LDGHLPGRTEDLKGFIQDGKLGKLRGKILERQEGTDAMLLQRPHRHGGRFFQRAIDLVPQPVRQRGIERASEDDQDDGQRRPVPERETHA